MLKKDITYHDLDGNPVTETFYFNLSKSEILEMQQSEGGADIRDHIRALIASRDIRGVMAALRDVIRTTVGKRSDDGRRFIKTPEYADEFMQTGAYDELLVELMNKPGAASEFIKAVVPADLASKVRDDNAGLEAMGLKEVEGRIEVLDISVTSTGLGEILTATTPEPPKRKEPNEYTREEMLAMSQTEFDEVFGTDHRKWSKDVLQIAFARRNN